MESTEYKKSLSVIVPVFNDEAVLPELHRRLTEVLPSLTPNYDIVFVDDGSADRSLEVLQQLQETDTHVIAVQLTRNFGQANAIAAGFSVASGDIFVLMDSDLQDRPEDIPSLIDAMQRDDVPMVVARWKERGDDPGKVAASQVFNRIANRITNVHYSPRSRVFRAVRREMVEKVLEMNETTSTPLSILGWMGVDCTYIDLDRDPRYAGSSGYTISRMLSLSLDRIFTHSLLPVRLASISGVLLGLSSILLATYFILQKLFFKSVLPGWTSTVVIVLFLLGMNFIFIGILGEYVGRIYLEVKKRPRYIIKRIFRGKSD